MVHAFAFLCTHRSLWMTSSLWGWVSLKFLLRQDQMRRKWPLHLWKQPMRKEWVCSRKATHDKDNMISWAVQQESPGWPWGYSGCKTNWEEVWSSLEPLLFQPGKQLNLATFRVGKIYTSPYLRAIQLPWYVASVYIQSLPTLPRNDEGVLSWETEIFL